MDSPDTLRNDEEKLHYKGIIINVGQTQYEVVPDVARKFFKWKVSTRDDDVWDVCWIDTGMTAERLIRMKPYQKINHFPGMHILARKNLLALNLYDMQQVLPNAYDFFPQTWLLPKDYAELKKEFQDHKNRTFIVKPEAECQGRGIFLTKDFEEIPLGARCVVQRYISKPMLIDGLKFDLRVYVLVTGCDPLRIFVHEDGLARFATEMYQTPKGQNLEEVCMHLTNYAINKDSSKFIFNRDANRDGVGHKRSLKSVFSLLSRCGYNTDALWQEIGEIITKTICSAQPTLAHIYRSCQPLDPADSMCFEILGVDILLDHRLKPWLLEVNHSPSFVTDTPLDVAVKQKVIADALSLLDISKENRDSYYELLQDRFYQRVIRAKKETATKSLLMRKQNTAMMRRQHLEERNTGGFHKLYPPGLGAEGCLEAAIAIWQSRKRNSSTKTSQEQPPKPRKTIVKPASRQEPMQEEPRKRSLSNKKSEKCISGKLDMTTIGSEQSILRPVLARKVPEGSFIKPKTLKFGVVGKEHRPPPGPMRLSWKLREMLRI